MDLIGKVFDNRYEIIERVGVGGMAVVYKAKCRLLNRYVAVKVLKQEFSEDELFVNRFRIEAQASAELAHTNIVSIYDVGKFENYYYLVMEFIDGMTLNDFITEKGVLSSEETCIISLQILSAIYKDAPLLILDEPTASLDAKAESEIYEDLFRMSKDKTTIFISHRLAASTIADRIIVFDGGQIVESGAHEELLRKNGLYAEMYMKQSRPYVTDTSG